MGDWLPLTAAQRGLFFAHELDPANASQLTAEVVDLTGPVDPGRLDAAQRAAYAEHEQLRTVMRADGDGPQQKVVPVETVAGLEVVDLSGAEDPAHAAQQWLERAVLVPFDLRTGPVVRSALLRLGVERHQWFHAAHHVVIDGYGALQLLRRVAELYADPGRPARNLATLADVVAEDAAQAASEAHRVEREFWTERVEGFDGVVALAGAIADPAPRAHRAVVPLDDELGAALAAATKRLGVSWPDFVTGAVGSYLARLGQVPSTRVGTPLMNRVRPGHPATAAARTVCTAMNVLPVTVHLAELGVAEMLAGTAADAAEVRAHPTVRQEELVRALGRRGAQLFGAQVNVLPFDLTLTLDGATGVVRNLTAGPVEDQTWGVRGVPGRGPLRLELDLNPTLYDAVDGPWHLRRMVHWLGVLAGAAPGDRVVDLPLLDQRERDLVLHGFNATDHPVEFVSLPRAFARAVEAHADRPALELDGRRTSYAELDDRARRIALSLRARRVLAGQPVGVMLPRSVDLFATIQGIGMVGATYLPLDPEHPTERLGGMAADAGAEVVVTDGGASLPGTTVLDLAAAADELAAWPVDEVAALLAADPGPTDPAYLLFTSGSTGRPKGVQVGQAAIRNRLAWMQDAFPLGPGSRVLHKTPISFDVSVWELYWPLTAGACVVVTPPGAHRDPLQVAEIVSSARVDLLHFVPSMLRALLADRRARKVLADRDTRPLTVVCSGEALPLDLVELCAEHLGVRPVNLYGPTEAAVDVTAWTCRAGDAEVPIGAPIWNTRCYVLDADDRPVGVGVPGQLHLAGPQLADGYVGRPDLTEAAFVPDPFNPGERMYRTGDLAAWREDGVLRYLGRADDQVKVHGQRLELGEVEAALGGVPGVGQVVAGLHGTPTGEAALVCWFTSDDDGELEKLVVALQERAAERLPAGVRPSQWVPVGRIPLGTTGKADRRTLAAQHPPAPPALPGGDEVPTSLRVQQVASAMASALGVGHVGPNDDFFAIGGDSMRVLRLVADLDEQHGLEVTLADVFAAPTPATLVASIGAAGDRADELGERLALRVGDPERWPLVLLPPAGGLGWCYTGLLGQLAPELGVHALQTIRLPQVAPEALTGLDALVARFVDHVEELLGELPVDGVHLAGWSLGGMAAHALAAELRARSVGVGAVVLLDAYPAEQWRTQPEPSREEALLGLLRLAGLPDPVDLPGLDESRVVELLRESRSPLAALGDEAFGAAVDLVGRGAQLVRTANPRLLDVPVTVVTAEEGRGAWLDPAGWLPSSPAGVQVVALPTSHPELVRDPWRVEVARVIDGAIRSVGHGN